MNANRIWTLGAVVAVVGILAAGFGLGVQPQLAAAATADAATAQTNTQIATTQVELARLSRLAATQTTLEATDSKLGSAVTSTLRLSTFSRQVRAIAALDGVTLTSLDPSTAKPYAPLVAATAGTTSSTSSGAATSTTAAPAATTPGSFGKTNALITPANFAIIPVSITVTGPEAAALQFASDAQHLTRLFAASNVTFAAGTSTGEPATTTVSGSIYALQR
ncbi:MAG: hypothetical protein HIU86_11680 [Acidobacteria bacterium]|nr:hypothetical protein [Acidobacteriota bacterium]